MTASHNGYCVNNSILSYQIHPKPERSEYFPHRFYAGILDLPVFEFQYVKPAIAGSPGQPRLAPSQFFSLLSNCLTNIFSHTVHHNIPKGRRQARMSEIFLSATNGNEDEKGRFLRKRGQ